MISKVCYIAFAVLIMSASVGHAIDPWGTPVVLSGSMGVMAQVSINDTPATSGDVVAAFVTVNGIRELRGKQSVQVANGIAGCLVQVYTETNGEIVEFMVWDDSSQQLAEVNQVLNTVVNSLVGAYPNNLYVINGTIGNGVLETPSFNPPAGTYTTAQSVIISCGTPEAVIRYTLDGSEPSLTSQPYSTALYISQNVTLKAKAFRSGWIDSQVATAVYTFSGTATEDPWQNPDVLTGSIIVMAEVAINGNSASNGDLLAAFVTVDNVEQIRGKAHIQVVDGVVGCLIQVFTETDYEIINFKVWDYSAQQIVPVTNQLTSLVGAVVGAYPSNTYHINAGAGLMTTQNPLFNPSSGLYQTAQNVTITCGTAGAQIRYTLDDSDPTPTSTLYTSAINIPLNRVRHFKARAYCLGYEPSEIVTASYTVNGPVPTPTIFPPGGTYVSSQTVSIQCLFNQAQIYYTTDGTEPTLASNLYTTPLSLTVHTTLKAMAVMQNWLNSYTVTAEYLIFQTVDSPAFSPSAGEYEEFVDVVISCPTEEADIYYTIDESYPTQDSQLYTEPLHLTSSTTVKAVAIKQGWITSPMTFAIYQISSANPDEPAVSALPGIRSLYPNPSHSFTTIKLVMDDRSKDYRLCIYNIRGECVYKQGGRSEAELEVMWDGKSDSGKRLPSGVYLVRFSSGSLQQTRKLVLN